MSGQRQDHQYRSPQSKARGLGSAKSGTHHFWVQRVTAIALIPLSLWFVFKIAQLSHMGYAEALEWIQSPMGSLGLVLFTFTAFYHAYLGMQVIYEDYIHHEGLKLVKRLGLLFILCALGVMIFMALVRQAL